LAHLRLASSRAAELHFEEPVSAWEVTGSGAVRVTTSKAVYEAERLIIAPGAWSADLLGPIALPLHVRRHVMAWFEPVRNAELFAPDRLPIYIWETHSGPVFYGFPATGSVKEGVKAAIHSGGDICAPDSITREIRESDIEEIREQLAEYIPALNGPLLHAATCMYTMTPDEHFVVAHHPEYAQVVIACGFSGHGFKFASVLGEVLADLTLEGHSRHAIDFLSPGRFSAS
jgi:sarcosine oxidase